MFKVASPKQTPLWRGLTYDDANRQELQKALRLPFKDFPSLTPQSSDDFGNLNERLNLLDEILDNETLSAKQKTLLQLAIIETRVTINPSQFLVQEMAQGLLEAGIRGVLSRSETLQNIQSLAQALPILRDNIEKTVLEGTSMQPEWRKSFSLQFALDHFDADPKREKANKALGALIGAFKMGLVDEADCIHTVDHLAKGCPGMAEIIYEDAHYAFPPETISLREFFSLKLAQERFNTSPDAPRAGELAAALLRAETAEAIESAERASSINLLLQANPDWWDAIYNGALSGARKGGQREAFYRYEMSMRGFLEKPDASNAALLCKALDAAPLPTDTIKATRQDLAAKYPDFGFKKAGLAVRLGHLAKAIGGVFHRSEQSVARRFPWPFHLI